MDTFLMLGAGGGGWVAKLIDLTQSCLLLAQTELHGCV